MDIQQKLRRLHARRNGMPYEERDLADWEKEEMKKPMYESKAKTLLNLVEEEPAKPSVDWQWETKWKDKDVMMDFHMLSKGSAPSSRGPSRDSVDPYGGEGELPEMELLAIWDSEGHPVQFSEEEKSQLEQDAAEKYFQEQHG